MKARTPWKPSKAEKKAMMAEINRQTIIADQKHHLDLDALILWALHVHPNTRFGKKRLRRFYDDFERIYQDLIDYYKSGKGEAAWVAHQELKKIGVDVKKWSEEK